MELILVRHAQNVLPEAQKSIDEQFIADTELTSTGQTQAQQLAAKLKTLRPTRATTLISSPAKRCVLTAEEVGHALGLKVSLEPRIGDRRHGSQRFENLDHYRQWQLDAWRAPAEAQHGSESLLSQRRRVRSWLVAAQGLGLDRMIVVTHGSVIEQVTGVLLGIPTRRMAMNFLQCDHAHFHRWDLRGSERAILMEANVSPTVLVTPSKKDTHAAISSRLAAESDASAFVVDKYYVR
ncbi:hypothetical protein DB032_19650 [Chromobacterium sp. Panama]|uniref:histidine phosphatase family protein n=1 Tax=Chromobacterium sp. Panama TaxID=2161826 RepID=UPI000D3221D1|nr:histidine phosphatase family protein [Chromobacterium sp. Panama]PTU66978.1 hypothetical protein DB032_19650 [Chromobacterium sp. Panama]